MSYPPLKQAALVLLLSAVVGISIGCSTGPSGTIDRWTAERGGMLVDARQARAERTLARLSLATVTPKELSIAVLDTSAVGAYCWPNGAVYVTRGLVDLVDDDELCAAIAHEAGHLVVDRHLSTAAALDGCRRSSGHDVEMAADRTAHKILAESGINSESLPRLLTKLANDRAASPAVRAHLSRRIAQLTTVERAG